jgi:hypothetical protein
VDSGRWTGLRPGLHSRTRKEEQGEQGSAHGTDGRECDCGAGKPGMDGAAARSLLAKSTGRGAWLGKGFLWPGRRGGGGKRKEGGAGSRRKRIIYIFSSVAAVEHPVPVPRASALQVCHLMMAQKICLPSQRRGARSSVPGACRLPPASSSGRACPISRFGTCFVFPPRSCRKRAAAAKPIRGLILSER